MRHEIIPNLRYADALQAINFLCEAFGFERKAVHTSDRDRSVVEHAQLVWADRMVMVYSMNDTEYARAANMKTAAEVGGPTVGLYLIVEDVDAHADRARAAGAEIILEPRDKKYGGRGYSARDPEGNVWSFGSYDPWADEQEEVVMIKPPGFTTVFPYIFATNADGYLRFLQEGLGGEVQNLHHASDGSVANAQIVFGDTTIMVSDAAGWSEPRHATYYIYVEDADAAMARAQGRRRTVRRGQGPTLWRSAGRRTRSFRQRLVDFPAPGRWGVSIPIDH